MPTADDSTAFCQVQPAGIVLSIKPFTEHHLQKNCKTLEAIHMRFSNCRKITAALRMKKNYTLLW
jgi:hypothetical protein